MLQVRKAMMTALALCVIATGAAYGWGAIAVDDVDGDAPDEVGYGSVTGATDEKAASAAALSLCESEGNSGCELVLTFEKCGAYAASRSVFGAASAATKQDAEQRAIAECGESGCQIVVSDCE